MEKKAPAMTVERVQETGRQFGQKIGKKEAKAIAGLIQGWRRTEDLTPEGIQLVIPGAERQQPAGKKQMELF